MTVERPASVKAAVWLTLGLVALSAVTSLLAIVFKTELRDAWESGRVDAGSVKPPAIVPVTVVMLIVVALVALVLVEFLRARHSWARIALTATLVMMALGTLGTIRIGPPTLFVGLSVVALVLQVAIVVALWHRDTSVFLRDQPVAGDVVAGS